MCCVSRRDRRRSRLRICSGSPRPGLYLRMRPKSRLHRLLLKQREGQQSREACEMLPDMSPYINSNTKSDPPQELVPVGADDVLVTMHTSGSSGLPKPIYQLHRFWTASLLTAPGRTLSAFTTTPLFHGGMSDLLRSIQAGSSIFFHPTADPGALSASAIVQAISACGVEISYFLSVPIFWICSSPTARPKRGTCWRACS